MKSHRCQNLNKKQARIETVIAPAFEMFPDGIPKDKQYWTLCAEQIDDEGSEMTQLVSSGLISQEQYYGIDSSKTLIEGNQKRFPRATWIHGDFYWCMSSFAKFNPAVIYLDTTGGIQTEKQNIVNVLNLLITRDLHDVLVIVNVIMKHRAIQDTVKGIMEVFENDVDILEVLNNQSIKSEIGAMWYRNDGSEMFTMFFTR